MLSEYKNCFKLVVAAVPLAVYVSDVLYTFRFLKRYYSEGTAMILFSISKLNL